MEMKWLGGNGGPGYLLWIFQWLRHWNYGIVKIVCSTLVRYLSFEEEVRVSGAFSSWEDSYSCL